MPLTSAWGRAAFSATNIVFSAVCAVFGLTLVAMVTDDARIFASMRASARTVLRDLGLAVPVIAALFLMDGLAVFPLRLLGAFVVDRHSVVAFAEHTGLSLGIRMIEALIGTWFLLLSFLWYRDASARLARPPFDTSPAPSVESA